MKRIVTVAAIQPNAEECYSEDRFYKKVKHLTFIAKQCGAELVVFPEGLSMWLSFAKEAPRVRATYYGHGALRSFSRNSWWRNWLEAASDWILKRLKLNFMGEWLSQAKFYIIIDRTFSRIAKECDVVIVAGSIYTRRLDGMQNISMIYERDGTLIGEVGKKYLIPVEESWGIKSDTSVEPVRTSIGVIGVCICADLNYPDVARELCDKGAELLCGPSGGWRPYPGYPFDLIKDMPQKERAKEVRLPIIRPYQCGWMTPGLFFDGRTSIVDSQGLVVAEARNANSEEVVVHKLEIGR